MSDWVSTTPQANACDTFSIWIKVFKNRPSKICGRQPLKNMK